MSLNVFPTKRLDANLWVFENLSEMRLGPDPTNLDVSFLLGSVTPFDGVLFGMYAFDATSSAADNGSTVISGTTVSGVGRWRQVLS